MMTATAQSTIHTGKLLLELKATKLAWLYIEENVFPSRFLLEGQRTISDRPLS